jgi:hypothetical protein
MRYCLINATPDNSLIKISKHQIINSLGATIKKNLYRLNNRRISPNLIETNIEAIDLTGLSLEFYNLQGKLLVKNSNILSRRNQTIIHQCSSPLIIVLRNSNSQIVASQKLVL